MLVTWGAGQSISNIVRNILLAFSGSLYLPSPSSCYQDTAGTLPCVVDTPVGLMLDEMRTLGPELVTSAAWAVAAGITESGGVITFASPAAFASTYQAHSSVIGKAYTVTFRITSYTSGSVKPLCGATGGATRSGVGTYTEIIIAGATNTYSQIQAQASSFVGVIDSFSVREVTGIHATQATAGFRPVLRGAVKNYLLNSATLSTQNVTCPLVPMTLSIYGTGSVTLSGGATGVLTGTGAGNRVTLTFTPTVASVTFTVAGSVTSGQLELGTVANPYVATGATPASSSYGPYCEEFDGVDDRQALSSVPFQMSDDFFVVVGCTNLSSSASSTVFSLGSTAATVQNISINFSITTGIPYFFMRDDAGTNIVMNAAAVPLGTPCVLAVTQIAGVRKFYLNGVQQGASNNTSLGAATFNIAGFGATLRATPVQFLNGKLNYTDYGIGAISDAQLLTTMRYAGQQVGVTIL